MDPWVRFLFDYAPSVRTTYSGFVNTANDCVGVKS